MSLSHFCTGPDPLLFQVCSPLVLGLGKSKTSDLDPLELDKVGRSHSKKDLCPLCQEECSSCLNNTCEECEYKSTEKGLICRIINDHEPKDVFNHFGLVWINNNHKSISRNLEYAQDRYHLEKWGNLLSYILKCSTVESPAGIKQRSLNTEGRSGMK